MWAQGIRTTSILGIAAFALVLLGACGQKGPLFVPGVPATAARPFPAPVKADPAPKKTPDVPARSDPATPESK